MFKIRRALGKKIAERLNENGCICQKLFTGYFWLLLFFGNVMSRRRLGFNLGILNQNATFFGPSFGDSALDEGFCGGK